MVESVVDYAIYMLDPSGLIVNWNAGARRAMGYEAHEIAGQHFSRFFTKEDRAAGLPWRVLEIATKEGRYEFGRLARAQGWQPVLGFGCREHDPRRGWRSHRLCRDYARCLRPEGGAGRLARKRAAVPAAGRGRDRLRSFHARSQWDRHELECWGEADQGIRFRGNRRAALRALLHRARQGGGRARACPADRGRRRALRSARLARPQERRALLGERDHPSHPGRGRQPRRLRKDHPGHHRKARGGNRAAKGSGAPRAARSGWRRLAI